LAIHPGWGSPPSTAGGTDGLKVVPEDPFVVLGSHLEDAEILVIGMGDKVGKSVQGGVADHKRRVKDTHPRGKDGNGKIETELNSPVGKESRVVGDGVPGGGKTEAGGIVGGVQCE